MSCRTGRWLRRAQRADARHGAAAAGADVEVTSRELTIALAKVRRGRRRYGRRRGEQASAQCELGGALAVGEEAVMADALKAVRQGVEQEAANELLGREGHDFALGTVAIVAPAEADAAVFELDQPAVGDRNPMV
jgi:hypothetical protein